MTTPHAWLGLAPAFAPQRVARVCMDCDDRADAEAMAQDMRCDGVSHGLCDACARVRFADILSQPNETRAEQSATSAGAALGALEG